MTEDELNKDMEQLFSKARQLFKSKEMVFAILLFLIIVSAFAYRNYTFTKGNLAFGGYPIPTNWDIALDASFARVFYETGDTRFQPSFVTEGGKNYINPQPVPTPLLHSLLAKILPLPPLQGIFFGQIIALILILFVSFAIIASVFDIKTAIIAASFGAIPSYQFVVHIYYGFYMEVLSFLMVMLALWMLVLYTTGRKPFYLLIFSLALGLIVLNHVVEAAFYLPFFCGLLIYILARHHPRRKELLRHSIIPLLIMLVCAAMFYQTFKLTYVAKVNELSTENFFKVQGLLPEFHNPTLSVPLMIIFFLGIAFALLNLKKMSFQKKAVVLFSLYVLSLYLLSFPLNKIYLWRQFIGFPIIFLFFGIFVTTVLNSVRLGEGSKAIAVVLLSLIIMTGSFYSYKDTLYRYRMSDNVNEIRWALADFVSKNTSADATVLKLESEEKSNFFGAYYYYMDRSIFILGDDAFLSGCQNLSRDTMLDGYYGCWYGGDSGIFYEKTGLFGTKKIESKCRGNLTLASFPVIVISLYSEEPYMQCDNLYYNFLTASGYRRTYANQAFVVLQK